VFTNVLHSLTIQVALRWSNSAGSFQGTCLPTAQHATTPLVAGKENTADVSRSPTCRVHISKCGVQA
jgi:hypothetical protein